MQIEVDRIELLRDIDEIEHGLAGLQMELDHVDRGADPELKRNRLLAKRNFVKTLRNADKKLIGVSGTLKQSARKEFTAKWQLGAKQVQDRKNSEAEAMLH